MTQHSRPGAIPTLILVLAASACAPAGDGSYPRLLPTDRILAEPALPAHAEPVRAGPAPVEAAASARAQALRNRAEALRGPVVDPGLAARAAR